MSDGLLIHARDIANAAPYAAQERVIRSQLYSTGTAITTTSGTAYFVYLGRNNFARVFKYAAVRVRLAAAGSQTAEIGIATSPLPPCKAAQTLTVLVATGTVDSLTSSTARKANTNAFTTVVPAGVYMWGCFRAVMATTQPTLTSLFYDWGQGSLLSLPGSGALATGSTYAGALIADASAAEAPDIRLEMD